MGIRDLNRFKKTYSFYRAVPVLEVTGGGGDITAVYAGTGLSGGGTEGDVTLVIDNSVVATLSGSIFSGDVVFNAGMSGSLTRLSNGQPYLIAGPNITIHTNSIGQIEVSSSAGGPGGSTNYIQINNGGVFSGSGDFTYNGARVHLTGSFSQGITSKANGLYTFANGINVIANGNYSHAEGSATQTTGESSHAEGYLGNAYGDASHVEGYGSLTYNTFAHAEGFATTASGYASHSEGRSSIASAHYSHAEGDATTSSGESSHAEGDATVASGKFAHTEGSGSKGFGTHSHAEGNNTHAVGDYSHAAGIFTIASGSGQNVVGKYNKRGNTDSLFIVGNGSGNANAQRDDILLINSGSVLIGSGNVPSDTFFFISGTIGGNKKSLFTGDAVVSGTLSVNTIQPTSNNTHVEITGKGTHTYDLVAAAINADSVTGTTSLNVIGSTGLNVVSNTNDVYVEGNDEITMDARGGTGSGLGVITAIGKLKAQAGTSTSRYRVPVNLLSSAPDINSTGPYTSGYIVEYTFAVPANSMIAAGDSIRGKFSATKVSAKNGQMRIKFGSTVVCERTMGTASTDLFMDFTIVAKTSSTQTSTAFWMENSNGSIYTHASPAETCTSAVNITVEFRADAADMVLKTSNLELWCS